MAELYTVSVPAVSRQEITGGRVGHFIVKCPGTGGDYFVGDSTVDNTTGVGLLVADPLHLYVTSPDEVYVYNENAISTGVLKILHNR